MRFWKATLGVGVACAACCAAPMVGSIAALATGATTLAAAGAAMLPCTDELAPLAGVLIVIAFALAGARLWKRSKLRRARSATACNGGCCAGTE